jgi:hypothetical protein
VWFSIHCFPFVGIKSNDRSSQPTGFSSSHPSERACYNRRPSFSGYSTQQEVFECSNWLTEPSTALDSHEPVSRLLFQNIQSSIHRNDLVSCVSKVIVWRSIEGKSSIPQFILPAEIWIADLQDMKQAYSATLDISDIEIISENFLRWFYVCEVIFPLWVLL